jgi:hypothetical protein
MRTKLQHAAILALVACGGAPTERTTVMPAASTQPVTDLPETELDARFVAAVRGAAAHYREWNLLDDDLRQAPIPCADPSGRGPLNIRRSVAGAGPHA